MSISFVPPTRNSPRFSISASLTLRSFTKVPLVLPRSRTTPRAPWMSSWAWCRDTSGSSIITSAPCRPMMTLAVSTRITRPASFPSSTASETRVPGGSDGAPRSTCSGAGSRLASAGRRMVASPAGASTLGAAALVAGVPAARFATAGRVASTGSGAAGAASAGVASSAARGMVSPQCRQRAVAVVRPASRAGSMSYFLAHLGQVTITAFPGTRSSRACGPFRARDSSPRHIGRSHPPSSRGRG